MNEHQLLSEKIKAMDSLEFITLDEVTPDAEGLWYTDRASDISEMVEVPEGHDDWTVWRDENLARQLQEKVVEAYEESEKWGGD